MTVGDVVLFNCTREPDDGDDRVENEGQKHVLMKCDPLAA